MEKPFLTSRPRTAPTQADSNCPQRMPHLREMLMISRSILQLPQIDTGSSLLWETENKLKLTRKPQSPFQLELQGNPLIPIIWQTPMYQPSLVVGKKGQTSNRRRDDFRFNDYRFYNFVESMPWRNRYGDFDNLKDDFVAELRGGVELLVREIFEYAQEENSPAEVMNNLQRALRELNLQLETA